MLLSKNSIWDEIIDVEIMENQRLIFSISENIRKRKQLLKKISKFNETN